MVDHRLCAVGPSLTNRVMSPKSAIERAEQAGTTLTRLPRYYPSASSRARRGMTLCVDCSAKDKSHDLANQGIRAHWYLRSSSLADLVAVHFVGPVGEAQGARVRVGVGERRSRRRRRRRRAPGSPSRSPGSAMFGRGDLDHRDLACARPCCRPCPSCTRRCSTSRRAWSIMMRASAMRSSVTRLLGERLAEGDARLRALAHRLQRALGQADQRACSGGCGPGPRRPCAISKPRPSPSSMFAAGTRTFVEHDLGVAVRRVVVAEHRRGGARPSRPGVSVGTRIIDCCRCRSAFAGSVLPMKMRDLAARVAARRTSTTCGR